MPVSVRARWLFAFIWVGNLALWGALGSFNAAGFLFGLHEGPATRTPALAMFVALIFVAGVLWVASNAIVLTFNRDVEERLPGLLARCRIAPRPPMWRGARWLRAVVALTRDEAVVADGSLADGAALVRAVATAGSWGFGVFAVLAFGAAAWSGYWLFFGG